MTTTDSSSNKELALLKNVLSRLALTDDDALTAFLARFLVPVLWKICSPTPSVRNKAIQVVVHVVKRVKPSATAQVPVVPMMEQMTRPTFSAVAKNFSVILLKAGFPRAPDPASVLPTLLRNFPRLTRVSDKALFLQQFLDIVSELPSLPEIEDVELWSAELLLYLQMVLCLDVNNRAEDGELLLSEGCSKDGMAMIASNDGLKRLGVWKRAVVRLVCEEAISDRNVALPLLLLIASGKGGAQDQGRNALRRWNLDVHVQEVILERRARKKEEEEEKEAAAAASSSDVVMADAVVSEEAGEDDDEEEEEEEEEEEDDSDVPMEDVAVVDAEAAAAAAAAAAAVMKKKKLNMEDDAVVSSLMTLCLGSGAGHDAEDPQAVRAVGDTAKVLVLDQLCMSVHAATVMSNGMRVVFDALFRAGSPKTQQAGVRFMQWQMSHCSEQDIAAMAPALRRGLLQLLDEHPLDVDESSKEDTMLRRFAYEALLVLARRMPQVICDSTDVLERMFDAVSGEADAVTRGAAQETAFGLLEPYAAQSAEIREMVRNLIAECLSSSASSVPVKLRLVLVKFAMYLFPFSDVQMRAVCVRFVDDDNAVVREEAERGLRLYRVAEKGLVLQHVSHRFVPYPSFGELVAHFAKHVDELVAGRGQFVACMRLLSLSGVHSSSSSSKAEEWAGFWALAWRGLDRDAFKADTHALALQNLSLAAELGPLTLRSVQEKETLWHFVVQSVNVRVRYLAARLLAQLCADEMYLERAMGMLQEMDAGKKRNVDFARHGCLCMLGFSARAHDVRVWKLLLEHVSVKHQYSVHVQQAALEGLVLHCAAKDNQFSVDAGFVGTLEELMRASSNRSVVTWIVRCIGACAKTVFRPEQAEECVDMLLRQHSKQKQHAIPSAQQQQKQEDKQRQNQKDANWSVVFHAAVGDALVHLGEAIPSLRAKVLHEVFRNHLYDGRAFVRVAASIWLMRHVELCADVASLTTSDNSNMLLSRLGKLLVDKKSDLVREAAARASCVLFERSARPEDVVAAVNRSLLTGSVSMYQELARIVQNVLGQPERIFDLLSLCSQMDWARTLPTETAAASAVAAVASDVHTSLHGMDDDKEALQHLDRLVPHVDKLVPSLYLLSLDPRSTISETAQRILDRLFLHLDKSQRAVVNGLEAPVLELILTSARSQESRVRQRSARALSEFLPGRFVHDPEQLRVLMDAVLNAMDDVQDDVRQIGARTLRSLKGVLHRQRRNVQSISVAFDLLLGPKGVHHTKEDVRSACIRFLQFLVQDASGPAIESSLARIVTVVLEALTQLEPQLFNYLAVHAQRMEREQQQQQQQQQRQQSQNSSSTTTSAQMHDMLDAARVSATRGSPLIQTLEECVNHMVASENTTVVQQVLEAVDKVIRTGVGTSTRAGALRVLCSLCTKCPMASTGNVFATVLRKRLLRPLNGCLQVLTEYSSFTVRQAAAIAVADVLRTSRRNKHWGIVCDTLLQLQQSGASLDHRALAVVLWQIARRGGDRKKRFFETLIPVAFVERYHGGVKASELGEKTLDELATPADITLHRDEICALLVRMLEKTEVSVRLQAARAVVQLPAEAAAGQPELVRLLRAGVRGRLFKGKDALLYGFVHVLQTPEAQDVDLLFRELSRDEESLAYVRHCLICLRKLFEKQQQSSTTGANVTNVQLSALLVLASNPEKEEGEGSGEAKKRYDNQRLALLCQAEALRVFPPLHLSKEQATLVWQHCFDSVWHEGAWMVKLVILEELFMKQQQGIPWWKSAVPTTSWQNAVDKLQTESEITSHRRLREGCAALLKHK